MLRLLNRNYVDAQRTNIDYCATAQHSVRARGLTKPESQRRLSARLLGTVKR